MFGLYVFISGATRRHNIITRRQIVISLLFPIVFVIMFQSINILFYFIFLTFYQGPSLEALSKVSCWGPQYRTCLGPLSKDPLIISRDPQPDPFLGPLSRAP